MIFTLNQTQIIDYSLFFDKLFFKVLYIFMADTMASVSVPPKQILICVLQVGMSSNPPACYIIGFRHILG